MKSTTGKNKKKGLGRGYGALLGEGNSDSETAVIEKVMEVTNNIKVSENKNKDNLTQPIFESRVYNIPIEKIENSSEQPRKKFDKEKLEQLSQSIKTNGIIQPIIVKKISENKFSIVAGERRWRASQLAGLKEIPAIVKDIDELKTYEIAIIENIQRENLNPIEEALAYHNLMDRFDLTQVELAEKVGKERATIANLLRLLNLGPEVKEMVQSGELSLGHAKLLLAIDERRLQFKVARKIHKSSLSIKQSNKLIKRLKGSVVVNKDEINSGITKQIKSLEQEMQKILGTKVKLNYDKGKSKVNIQFYTVSELNNFVNHLRDNWNK